MFVDSSTNSNLHKTSNPMFLFFFSLLFYFVLIDVISSFCLFLWYFISDYLKEIYLCSLIIIFFLLVPRDETERAISKIQLANDYLSLGVN